MKLKIRLIAMLVGISAGFYILYATLGKYLLQEAKPSIGSFILVHFSGYIFFILSPVELLFIQFSSFGYSAHLLISLAVATAMIAQILDYSFGYFIGDNFIKSIIGDKKYEKTSSRLAKYGNPVILLFNILPLSSPIVVLVAGMLRLRLKDVMLYSFLGLTVKYAILAVVF